MILQPDTIDFMCYNRNTCTKLYRLWNMIRECKTKDDLETILSGDSDRPVFVLKHSTICPISAAAWKEFSSFSENEERALFWRVMVREDRDLSREIAARCKVVHESPQVILLKEGRTISSRTHYSITEKELANMLSDSN